MAGQVCACYRVAHLAAHARPALVGGPTWQPNIIHTSLLRILTPVNLDDYTRQLIADKCHEWTTRLQGRSWTPKHMWMVYETEFTTIAGERNVVPFRSQA
jgi:hypothetical protein